MSVPMSSGLTLHDLGNYSQRIEPTPIAWVRVGAVPHIAIWFGSKNRLTQGATWYGRT